MDHNYHTPMFAQDISLMAELVVPDISLGITCPVHTDMAVEGPKDWHR